MRIAISPSGFARLKDWQLRFENMGWSADAAAYGACGMVGIYPQAMGIKPYEGIDFLVDYSLDGPIWPFEDWPHGWVKDDPATWH